MNYLDTTREHELIADLTVKIDELKQLIAKSDSEGLARLYSETIDRYELYRSLHCKEIKRKDKLAASRN